MFKKGNIPWNKGKTYEELFGEKEANNLKSNLSRIYKGKTYEQIYGDVKAKLKKQKQSESHKIFYKSKLWRNYKKQEYSKRNVKWTNKVIIKKFNRLQKEIGPLTRTELNYLNQKYDICTPVTIRKKFGSLDNFQGQINESFEIPRWESRLGKNELEILNRIEKEKNIKLEKQYFIKGRYLDGYDKRNNIVYEVDEEYHGRFKVEDSIREKEIKDILNCDFIRIKDRGEVQKCLCK